MSRPHIPLVRWFRPARRIAKDAAFIVVAGLLMLLVASLGSLS